jgi:hypothetical protein
MTKAAFVHGVVFGRTIQLAEEPGFPDGQQVQITISPLAATEVAEPQEALKRAFGAWADEADAVDDFLQWNRQQRKVGRAAQAPA